MKKKYDKNNNKKRNALKMFMTILGIIVVLGIVAIVYFFVNNNVVYVNVDESAKNATENESKSSTPIIVNNVVLGGVYNGKFVSLDKYFLYSTNKKDYDIDMYSSEGKIGEYKINSIYNQEKASVVYVSTTKENLSSEYVAVGKGASNIVTNNIYETVANDEDFKVAKKSLGLYRFLNSSLSINKVYETNIENGVKIRILCITNEPKKSIGAYSAIVVYDQLTGKSNCIKYNYVRDVKNAEEFGINSLKFVCDLNGDGINEIIIQETKEFKVKYSVMTYKKNKFYEVLATEFEA